MLRFGIVTVGAGAPHQQKNQHAHDSHAEDADIGPVPAVMLRHIAQSDTRNDGARITEQP